MRAQRSEFSTLESIVGFRSWDRRVIHSGIRCSAIAHQVIGTRHVRPEWCVSHKHQHQQSHLKAPYLSWLSLVLKTKMEFTFVEKADMLKLYYPKSKNSVDTSHKYQSRYPDRRAPSRTHFSKLDKALRNFGPSRFDCWRWCLCNTPFGLTCRVPVDWYTIVLHRMPEWITFWSQDRKHITDSNVENSDLWALIARKA